MSSVGATLICKTVILLSIAFPADSTTGFAILFAETVLTVDEEIRVTPSSLATIFELADVVLATTAYRGDATIIFVAATFDTFEVPVDVASIGVTATAVDVFTERPVAVAFTLARATALDVLVEVPVVFELVVVTAEAVEFEIALPRTVVTPERCVCSAVAEDVASAVTLVVGLATATPVEVLAALPEEFVVTLATAKTKEELADVPCTSPTCSASVTTKAEDELKEVPTASTTDTGETTLIVADEGGEDPSMLSNTPFTSATTVEELVAEPVEPVVTFATASAVELEVVCPVTSGVTLLETARAVELEVVCPVTSGVTLLETARAVLELKAWPRMVSASVSMINIFSALADVVAAQEVLAVASTIIEILVVPSGVSENANAPNAIRIS